MVHWKPLHKPSPVRCRVGEPQTNTKVSGCLSETFVFHGQGDYGRKGSKTVEFNECTGWTP